MKNTLQLFVKLKSPRTFEFQWFRAHFNPFCCKTQVILYPILLNLTTILRNYHKLLAFLDAFIIVLVPSLSLMLFYIIINILSSLKPIKVVSLYLFCQITALSISCISSGLISSILRVFLLG